MLIQLIMEFVYVAFQFFSELIDLHLIFPFKLIRMYLCFSTILSLVFHCLLITLI